MQKYGPDGVGNVHGPVQVYMANRPAFDLAGESGAVTPIDIHIINSINAECGNGWRKVFNVYAKWIFSLCEGLAISKATTWQSYRDEQLLTAQGDTALWFAPPPTFNPQHLNIVMGKTYAGQLDLTQRMNWVSADFAVCRQRNLIVTPYFDYRQLTNEKVGFLNYLIRSKLLDESAMQQQGSWLQALGNNKC